MSHRSGGAARDAGIALARIGGFGKSREGFPEQWTAQRTI
jgi:hypothetical protein